MKQIVIMAFALCYIHRLSQANPLNIMLTLITPSCELIMNTLRGYAVMQGTCHPAGCILSRTLVQEVTPEVLKHFFSYCLESTGSDCRNCVHIPNKNNYSHLQSTGNNEQIL
jgi:hypothetical protein